MKDIETVLLFLSSIHSDGTDLAQLATDFGTATNEVKSFSLSNTQKLILYGLFKQSEQGDVTSKRPSLVNRVACLKYDAWLAFQGIDSTKAKIGYVSFVSSLRPKSLPSSSSQKDTSIDQPNESQISSTSPSFVNVPITTTNVTGFDDQTTTLSTSIINNDINNEEIPVIHFTKKHTFSLKNNPMCGICLIPWLTILWQHLPWIEIQYYPRMWFVSLLSIFNSCLGGIEHVLYHAAIHGIEVPDDPIFIIGHPRTGTTLLHNLLSSDTEHFFYATTFCVGFPSCFLWFESWGKWLLAPIIDRTRPMDNMPLHFDLPQEDEMAVNLLSAGRSYYMPLWFMRQEQNFRKYLDFSEKDGGSQNEEKQWTQSFLYFFRKVCLREKLYQRSRYHHRHRASLWGYIMQWGVSVYRNICTTASRLGLFSKQGQGLKGLGPESGVGSGPLDDKIFPSLLSHSHHNKTTTTAIATAATATADTADTNEDQPKRRRLIIKSPVHTARVPLLRRLFPRASFIYLHRHPEDVLVSSAHMADTAYWYCYFNTPTDQQVTSFIFHQFETLWSKYNTAALGRDDRIDDADGVDYGKKDQYVDNEDDEDEHVTVTSSSRQVLSRSESTSHGDGKNNGEHYGGGGRYVGQNGRHNGVENHHGCQDYGDNDGQDDGLIDGDEIHGWTNSVFRDDNLLRLVRRRRQGQGSGQGQGQGLGQGLRDKERQHQDSNDTHDRSGGVNNGRHDRDNGDGSNGRISSSGGSSNHGDVDGMVSRNAAVRRLLYLSDDILEISYRDLVSDPYHTLSQVYDHIQVPWTDQQETHYQQQMEVLRGYQPNHKTPMSEPLKKILKQRWYSYYEAFGYE